MIEFTSYDRVEQHERGGSDGSPANRQDEESVSLSLSTVSPTATVQYSETLPSSLRAHTGGMASIERIFVNLLGLIFVLSLSFAIGGVPFPQQLPTPPTHRFGIDDLNNFFSRRPLPPPVVTARPRVPGVFQTCRPPTTTSDDNDQSSLLTQVYQESFVLPATEVRLSGDASIMVRLEPDYYALGRRLHDLRGKVQTYGWDCETNQYENIADDLFGQHSYQYFGLSAQLSDNCDGTSKSL